MINSSLNPVIWIEVGPLRIHPHPLFEMLGAISTLGLILYLRRHRSDTIPLDTRQLCMMAGIIGAAVGANLLAFFEHPHNTLEALQNLEILSLFSGRTVVGGLLGGWIAVEITKKKLGETRSTGDALVFPLTIGIIIGRIGCVLSGLDDMTHGAPTTWFWGIDFGDGISRHPVRILEILVLITFLMGAEIWNRVRPLRDGLSFRVWMGTYLAWRLLSERLKPRRWTLSSSPRDIYIGLTAIEGACIMGLSAIIYLEFRRKNTVKRSQEE